MTIQSDYQPVRSGLSVVGSLNTYFQDSHDRWHCRAVTRGPNASNRRSNSPKIGAQALVMTSTPSPRRSASPCRRLSFGKLESAGLRHSTKDSPHVLLGVERHGAQRRGRAACHGGLLAPHAGLQRARARLHLVKLLCVDTCRVRHRRFFLTFVSCHARRNDDCKRFLRGLRAPLNAEYARHARAASRACARHISAFQRR